MAITGVHALIYTSEPEALRAVLKDILGWPHVDAGDGWLIFRLPPAELGIHPAEGPTYDSGVRHQLTLMCDDLRTTVKELQGRGEDPEKIEADMGDVLGDFMGGEEGGGGGAGGGSYSRDAGLYDY